jgi:hypothetical protein
MRVHLDLVTSEDGAAWLAYLRSLVARGLSCVQLDAEPRARRPDTKWGR